MPKSLRRIRDPWSDSRVSYARALLGFFALHINHYLEGTIDPENSRCVLAPVLGVSTEVLAPCANTLHRAPIVFVDSATACYRFQLDLGQFICQIIKFTSVDAPASDE